ncbi:hypothetical protein ACFOTA_04280 [Chitinophaga sp. GCM10012297]|uniref:Uncharacterized protein n=1 Tax=Chitinophaga chungangae TaxID=2821488 RepID=A0ABS3Y9T1_9BACT|nr:hypothetical protein [Chitinophaga chungangae]MBO9151411.1 hypothetical protein [Chitinophaga chungangae]
MMPSSQELLFIVIIAGAVVLVIWTLKDTLKKGEKKEKEEKEKELKAAAGKTEGGGVILPLQLQAYERIVLFVERIAPQNLISRVNQPGFTVLDMQIAMVSSIKSEYDHNVSQQIYVTAQAWEAVKTVKEQTISIINQIGLKLPPDAPSIELNKQILELFMLQPESPSDIAIEIINSEARKLMQH